VLLEVKIPAAACVAVMVISESVYAIIVAMPSRIVIGGGVGEAEMKKVYAPLLSLTPDITDISENPISTPYVFTISLIGR